MDKDFQMLVALVQVEGLLFYGASKTFTADIKSKTLTGIKVP